MKRGSFQIAGEPHPTPRREPLTPNSAPNWGVIGCTFVFVCAVMALIVKAAGG